MYRFISMYIGLYINMYMRGPDPVHSPDPVHPPRICLQVILLSSLSRTTILIFSRTIILMSSRSDSTILIFVIAK